MKKQAIVVTCDVDFVEENTSLVQKDAPAVQAVCVPINEEDQEDVTGGNKQQKIHRTANSKES